MAALSTAAEAVLREESVAEIQGTNTEDDRVDTSSAGQKNCLKRLFGMKTFASACLVMLALLLAALPAQAEDAPRKVFKSPQEAFNALVGAARHNDTLGLMAILGPDAQEIVSSGDAVADTYARERFVRAVDEKVEISKMGDETRLVLLGKDGWCFPIPIVKKGNGWAFLTEEGKQEILNRRIGRNELSTIQVMLAYLNAQLEYASIDRDGDGVVEYARSFVSSKGMKDGLYWESSPGEHRSPLGPLVASASESGYSSTKEGMLQPYHGYYFKILTSQGKSADGGPIDYIVDGRMTGGFALLAYPAQYGSSGVMTFIVNHEGVVYEKDLGPDTLGAAKAITSFDPDDTWAMVEPAK